MIERDGCLVKDYEDHWSYKLNNQKDAIRLEERLKKLGLLEKNQKKKLIKN